MTRLFALLFSVTSYFVAVVTLLYLIFFIADVAVPFTINAGYAPTNLHLGTLSTVLWNIALIGLWGAQHSIMARPAFKQWWTQFVPHFLERSVYLLAIGLTTFLLVVLWQPLPAVIWDVSGYWAGPVLTMLYIFGWCVVFISTFLINHFHLFGLEQVYLFLRGQAPSTEVFRTPLLYKLVRHPMMTGVLISLWAAPVLTVGRLVFAVAMTAYVFIGLYFEERSLAAELGDTYKRYQQTTPKVIPFLKI